MVGETILSRLVPKLLCAVTWEARLVSSLVGGIFSVSMSTYGFSSSRTPQPHPQLAPQLDHQLAPQLDSQFSSSLVAVVSLFCTASRLEGSLLSVILLGASNADNRIGCMSLSLLFL